MDGFWRGVDSFNKIGMKNRRVVDDKNELQGPL